MTKVKNLTCLSLLVTVILLFPAYGRRGRDADFEDARSGDKLKTAVAPTYLDTLNRGRELSLANDYSELKSTAAQDEDEKTGASEKTELAPDGSDGFRIQCMAGNDIEKVKAFKRQFESKLIYPAAIVFDDPYYKLQAGSFTTRNAAEAALREIKAAGYSEAWIVKVSTDSRRREVH
jgi:hypothetical protein